MLLDCDFIKHGFKGPFIIGSSKLFEMETTWGKIVLCVTKSHKKTQKVVLEINNQKVLEEMMWSPQQLLEFVKNHQLIA